MGNLDPAAVDFDKAIALSPDYLTTYGDRAFLRFKTQDNPGAIEDIHRALSADDSSENTSQRQLFITRCLTHFCLAATDANHVELAIADFEQLVTCFLQTPDHSPNSSAQSSSQTSKRIHIDRLFRLSRLRPHKLLEPLPQFLTHRPTHRRLVQLSFHLLFRLLKLLLHPPLHLLALRLKLLRNLRQRPLSIRLFCSLSSCKLLIAKLFSLLLHAIAHLPHKRLRS